MKRLIRNERAGLNWSSQCSSWCVGQSCDTKSCMGALHFENVCAIL